MGEPGSQTWALFGIGRFGQRQSMAWTTQGYWPDLSNLPIALKSGSSFDVGRRIEVMNAQRGNSIASSWADT